MPHLLFILKLSREKSHGRVMYRNQAGHVLQNDFGHMIALESGRLFDHVQDVLLSYIRRPVKFFE